nr:TetR/AcrR family transcriptional regulator [Enterobacter hormaechei]
MNKTKGCLIANFATVPNLVARPKSEDKKQALLEAATAAFAQSGIAASTALIARNAGVAEGTLFRYFATKDDLLNALYLHLKQDLCQTMLANLDRTITQPKEHTRNIWNSYVDWGIRNPLAHAAIRQIGVSEKLNIETEQAVKDMFPEIHELCHRSVRPVFMSDEFKTFGDAIFLSLAETTMEFAARDPSRAVDIKALGFEAMWRGLAEEESHGQ